MNTPCPHCSAVIEIDPATHTALAGQSHFDCPACEGAVPVPAIARPRLSPAPGTQTVTPSRVSSHLRGPTRAFQKKHRNFLILATTSLLVLGGIAFMLASRNLDNTYITTQNIRNEIINNSYFQNLVATGVTTMKDLDTIADIRPHEDGFIGISREPLAWQQAQDLARRTGSEILSVGDSGGSPRKNLVKWLTDTFNSHISPSAWIRERTEGRVLVGSEVLAATELNGMRRTFLHWKTSRPIDVILASATKDQPFVNKLGMKFVPVPGTSVLMCIHETRRQDYAAYAADSSDAVHPGWAVDKFNGIPSGHGDAHPVCFVNLEDASGFCEWLSRKEGMTYRLPTDQEWSYAVGIGQLEKRGPSTNPSNLHGSVPNVYPWGGTYPPRTEEKSGNYADLTLKERLPKEPIVPGYRDGFATTAPVMGFRPNYLGIYDLGGNLWEWCNDLCKRPDGSIVANLRGGAYNNDDDADYLLSSCRFGWEPKTRTGLFGFRVVVAVANQYPIVPSPHDPDRARTLALITRLGGQYEEDAASAANPKPVVKVRLTGKAIDNTTLRELRFLPTLRSLDLNSCDHVGDAGLAGVANMKLLESLDLGHCYGMTDEGFKHLAGLTKLTSLKLQESGSYTYTGTGLVHLKALTGLKEIDLAYSLRLEDANLVHLASLKNLRNLNLMRCEKLTDSALGYLAALISLEKLNLAGTQVTDAGLGKLEALKQMKEITLGGKGPELQTKVTDAGIARLQQAIPGLKIICD